MAGSLFGPYLLGSAQPYLNQLSRLQPKVALFFEPNRDDVAEFQRACPDTITVGRLYRPDSEVQDKILINPEQAARWVHDMIMAHPARHLISFWTVENEVAQFYHQLAPFNIFLLERMRLADQEGYSCGLAAHSVGNLHMPDSDRMGYYRVLEPAMREAARGGHVWLWHQYGWPRLWGPEEKGGAPWLIHRTEMQVLPRLTFKPPKIIISEFGMDGLIVGPRARGYADSDIDAEQYARDLINIGQYIESQGWTDFILGYVLFCLGTNGDEKWRSYSIEGTVLQRLAEAQYAPPPTPPTEVPVTTPVRVYDQDGVEKDEAWLAVEYDGAKVVRAPDVVAGKEVFRIVAVYVTEGPATMIAEVRGLDGKAKTGQPVAFTYPSLEKPDPSLPDLSGSAAKNLWSSRGAYQTVDQNGVTGFGLGGSYGPLYAAWVISPGANADVITKIGMLGGTNHRGPLRVVWQLVKEPVADEPPVVVDPPSTELLPENETATDPGTLAIKVRWWMEESVRQREQGNSGRADRIMYSLIKKNGGLLYRLEALLAPPYRPVASAAVQSEDVSRNVTPEVDNWTSTYQPFEPPVAPDEPFKAKPQTVRRKVYEPKPVAPEDVPPDKGTYWDAQQARKKADEAK